jgi:hypothetical protein
MPFGWLNGFPLFDFPVAWMKRLLTDAAASRSKREIGAPDSQIPTFRKPRKVGHLRYDGAGKDGPAPNPAISIKTGSAYLQMLAFDKWNFGIPGAIPHYHYGPGSKKHAKSYTRKIMKCAS